MDIYQGDPAISITPNGATIVYIGGNPVMDAGLHNQALIALFTKKGWAGNHLFDDPNQQIGSDFEELASGTITLSRLALIENSAVNALSSDLFGNVRAIASNPRSDFLEVIITIQPPGQDEQTILIARNGQNWISQAINPAHGRLSN